MAQERATMPGRRPTMPEPARGDAVRAYCGYCRVWVVRSAWALHCYKRRSDHAAIGVRARKAGLVERVRGILRSLRAA